MAERGESSTKRDDYGNEIEEISISQTGVSTLRQYISENKINWGDFEFDEDDEVLSGVESGDEEMSVDSDTVEKFDAGMIVPAGETVIMDSQQSQICYCKEPVDLNSCINLMQEMLTAEINSNNYACFCNNIISCYNFIYTTDCEPISEYKLSFTDYFFRLRHEILFKMMCLSLNLPAEKSDVMFSKWGIISNRTPDLIFEKSNCLIIVEVTATSSLEKAAATKGMEQMGFESKYQKEIDMLVDAGYNVSYMPLFFNMSETDHPVNRQQFNVLKQEFNENKIYSGILNILSKQLAIITNEIKHQISLSASILFTDAEYIKPNHKNHEFLYSNDLSKECNRVRYRYKELTVASNIYNKVINNWDRLERLMDESKVNDSERLSLIINTSSHRIQFRYNRFGLLKTEMMDLINNSDKVGVFKNVFLETGGKIYPCIDSETGVKFLETTEDDGGANLEVRLMNVIRLVIEHERSKYVNNALDLSKYVEKCEIYKSQAVVCNVFDQKYEDQIISSICKMDSVHDLCKDDLDINTLHFSSSGKLLGQMESKNIDIESTMSKIRVEYIEKNTEAEHLPKVILKMKSPFIVPLACINSSFYCKIEYKNITFINDILDLITDQPYTSTVLKRVVLDSYKMYTEPKLASAKLQELINDRSNISNKINKFYKQVKKMNPDIKSLKKLNNEDDKNTYNILTSEYRSVQKEIKNRQNIEGVGKDISYIRLQMKGRKKSKKTPDSDHNTNSMNKNQKDFEKEMVHFRDKRCQNTIEGFGISQSISEDLEFDQDVFNNICTDLMTFCGNNPDSFIHNYVSDDSRLLKDLKNASMKEYECNINFLRNSMLGHASSFVSRLGHSLMFYSQQSFSGDYVRVDNLGYKNVLLIIKGGEKIFKTKQSKMFRLIYPISDTVSIWFTTGQNRKSSTEIVEISGQKYAITPWSFWHENILTDSISFYHRICSFTLLNLNPKIEISTQFHKLQLNILLAFHNRRQTETLLANMRYILLSTLGDYTGVEEIIKEFFGFNYDRFQAFIRNCIIERYSVYFRSIQSLKNVEGKKDITESSLVNNAVHNIFTNNLVNNSEDLVLMIYSTFLMTKAPYQKLIERSNNLKGILKIHELYNNTVGLEKTPEEQFNKINVSLDTGGDYIQYSNKLFENDFNFDAKYCALMGNFMNSYFENEGLTEQIHHEWVKIMNSNWDEMATSTGLRGSYDNIDDFWGKKGYFVIYKDLLSNEEFRETLYSLLNCNLSDHEKRKILRNSNRVYKSECKEHESEFLIFHAVDKSQWRGSREIYVMNIDTKIMQQPIEKYVGFLCKKIDNELISVPSDRRAQVIHHSIFEKDLPLRDVMTWYLSLDCSKWAPKSIVSKFVIFFNNMRCIPNSFKIHFMNYVEKLYNKRLYFNIGEVEVLKKNPQYTSICDQFLKKDEKVNGYYLEAPYSWVMGIFNYVSSILHAANQKYYSYLLTKTTLLSYKEDITMVMYAHSDDSGGRICTQDNKQLRRALILYEINLHAGNHLLSKKKSVVSKIYFEILSIMYMFKKLLSLLPKFLGGLRFLPTDKGPAQDILQSYSKCIEVLVSGADFTIAYIVMKVTSHLIYKFYFNKDPNPIDYERPVQYIGMPDAHPIMVLLCGSDADIIRLIRTDEGYINIIQQLSFINVISTDCTGEGPIKPIKFLIKIKNLTKDFDTYIGKVQEFLENWSIKNVNYHNTCMNTFSFLKKLQDPGFVGSLVNESTVRRISRAYFMSYGNSVITRFGNLKLKPFIDGLKLFTRLLDKNNAVREMLGNILKDKDMNELLDEVSLSNLEAEKQMEVLKRTVASPLKLLKYFDRLTLEGREIVNMNRTLKPTLVQLVKGNNIFSVDFEPASLVSYLKDPDLRWALQNVKNLNTASLDLERYLSVIGKSIEEMEPDLILRICRTFGRDNVRNIYLYSRVPGNIRQIKSYSAFLTFLAVNSFANKEISGLTIKLKESDMGKEYVMTRVSDDIYLVNNIINLLIVLIKKCDLDFILKVHLNEVAEIGFEGGKCLDLLNKVEEILVESPEGSLCKLQFNILKSYCCGFKSINIYEGAFYTFIKEQKSKSGWYGLGEVYVYINRHYYSFCVENNKVISVTTNKTGKIDQIHERYIMDVFENINIVVQKRAPDVKRLNDYAFGFDNSGNLSILPGREIVNGVPCKIKANLGGYVDELDNYDLDEVIKDYIILKLDSIDKKVRRKVYMLPLKRVELLPLIKQMISYENFATKASEMGLNDFEDFLMTELMPEYGSELSVGFDQFINNYSSSRTYTILKECVDKNYSKLPNKPEFSILPANETSLVRLFIDYSNNTNDKIIISPSYMDTEIMKLRSEYPEQMPTVFIENLVKNYENIYNGSERREIEQAYCNIVSNSNIDLVRNDLIKLMMHWGYSSLVNVLGDFKLVKREASYVYFNFHNCVKLNPSMMAIIYPRVIKVINNTIENFSLEINKDDLPYPNLIKYYDPTTCAREFVISNCLSLYGLHRPLISFSFAEMCYLNIIHALFKIDEAVDMLNEGLKDIMLLSSIIIDHKNRFNFTVLMNTLKFAWQDQSKIKFKLDYISKLQRTPDDIPSILSLVKPFGMSLNPRDVYHHTMLNNEMISYMQVPKEIWISDDLVFKISHKIKPLSNTRVPIVGFLPFNRPLKEETFDEEMWEEIMCELTMEDVDEDTVMDMWGEMQDPLIPKRTRVQKLKTHKSILATITWVVVFGYTGSLNYASYVRQCGENIFLITDTVNNAMLNFPNSGARVVNFSKLLNVKCKPCIIYYTVAKELNNDKFIDEILNKGETIDFVNNMRQLKGIDIRDSNGKIKSANMIGVGFTGKELIGEGSKFKVVNDVIVVASDDEAENASDNDKSVTEIEPTEQLKLSEEERAVDNIHKVNESIEKISNDLNLDPLTKQRLKDKYMGAEYIGVSLDIIFKSIITESSLIKVKNNIEAGEFVLTQAQHTKMMHNPTHFGLAFTGSKTRSDPIKDKKVKCEIKSIHNNLPDLIFSGQLFLSETYKNILLSHYKMWYNMVKHSDFKNENKKFLLQLFLTLVNSAKVAPDETNDPMWREIIDKCTVYFAQTLPDSDEDDAMFNGVFAAVPGARIQYRSEGM